ncbi:L-aspartate oxidase [Salinisphaera hydrothermalis]|uniref:Fumarate reductase, or succinate dehydrogenase, flavoprotein subunit n=1 Tax=Salinisphaera hydrothermalis (strain C41B8) TaxID=1304275 RepID=A0A084IPN4_SALHC|nr:FAD-binding protein [Salinisphaera hydrothermalis]KEZ78668.1 fumarate reductase, or succinate dehydrogenase, flavoprotein subunit [Salinisphaera hydrothermalis C41B8]
MKEITTDILVLGSGGAGLLAALHAKQAAPDLSVTIAVKGLLGKCGCTRMVQGGYNVALAPTDSTERHFMDTLNGGKWLNNQDVAWTLVEQAQVRIRELENVYGCFFDRNADGTVHQKAFAGQTFDRTVHRGDLTGIEIISRLAEQTWATGVDRLEEHRAVALIRNESGDALAGVLMIDIRSGEYVFCRARAVMLGTGGGPTMYKYHTPSGDKSCDGLAMALAAGLALRDMEMVQFHPTGLLAGEHTRMTGTVLEEGLRGAGGYLFNGDGERFMERYDERGERATRDIVSRGIFSEIQAGRATPNGGAYIYMAHLGPDKVRAQFKGMVKRCADCGFDLAGERVEVIPTAHYMMGGVVFDERCFTSLPGLFVAGEDAGGVHGANRLGGNGVANSTVFGGIAGDTMAAWVDRAAPLAEPSQAELEAAVAHCERPFQHSSESLQPIREALYDLMWEKVGIAREETAMHAALDELDVLAGRLRGVGVDASSRAYNVTWHDWLNLASLITVSRAITEAALARRESRGAHFRSDFPEMDEDQAKTFTVVRAEGERLVAGREPVQYTRLMPGESLLVEDATADEPMPLADAPGPGTSTA